MWFAASCCLADTEVFSHVIARWCNQAASGRVKDS